MERAQLRLQKISSHLCQSYEKQLISNPTSANITLQGLEVTDTKENYDTITLENLKKKIGTEIGASQWFPITQDRVDAFATVTVDPQWIHQKDAGEKGSPFGGPIVHGFLTLSLIPFLLGQVLPKLEGVRMGVNYGFNKIRFVSPVHVGKSVRIRVTLKAVEEISSGVQLVLAVTVDVEGSKKPSVVMEWLTRMYF
eukprot:TRINITY_DN199_c0_g1_i2.p1 TRINITY_DN199_c0_g1~~TRINITY_DN199_c0_g1_i2.p1  ORF type:complete len:210 (+),score=54.88 TRINITY_DN199_c0_g1_i2:43-630(+)